MPIGLSSLSDEKPETPRVRNFQYAVTLHKPIIVLGGALLLVLVLVGLFIFLVYVVTHWTLFVQQTVLLVNAAYLFVGILAVCALAALIGWMGCRVILMRETIRERTLQRQLTEFLPSLPENVIAAKTGSPYVVMPVAEEQYRYTIRMNGGVFPPDAAVSLPPPAPLQLPEPCDLYTVMRRFDLSPDNLFLALAKGGQHISCSQEAFMHVLHDAPTGGGKTVQWFAEMVMLLKLGTTVILANPHFAPIDEKGRDWRPIGRTLEAQGRIVLGNGGSCHGLLTSYEGIAAMLQWLSQKELDRRYLLRRQGDFSYPTLYLFLDELAAVVDRYPNTPLYLADVLRRGRAVNINVDTNNQGFLNRDVEMKGSSVFNFNTAFHLGGSPHSASKVLETPLRDINTLLKQEEIPRNGLGKGIALLRQSSVCPQATMVRLPYPAPDYAVRMLGRADDWVLPELRSGSRRSGNACGNSTETGEDSETRLETAETPSEAKEDAIRAAFPVSHEAYVSTDDIRVETRETVKWLYQNGMPLRAIAPWWECLAATIKSFEHSVANLAFFRQEQKREKKGTPNISFIRNKMRF